MKTSRNKIPNRLWSRGLCNCVSHCLLLTLQWTRPIHHHSKQNAWSASFKRKPTVEAISHSFTCLLLGSVFSIQGGVKFVKIAPCRLWPLLTTTESLELQGRACLSTSCKKVSAAQWQHSGHPSPQSLSNLKFYLRLSSLSFLSYSKIVSARSCHSVRRLWFPPIEIECYFMEHQAYTNKPQPQNQNSEN